WQATKNAGSGRKRREGALRFALTQHSEAHVVRRVVRQVVIACGGAQVRGARLPASAAVDAFRAGSRAARVHAILAFVVLEVIEAPLEDIARHVLKAKWTRATREAAYGRGLGEAVVDVRVAPGKGGLL